MKQLFSCDIFLRKHFALLFLDNFPFISQLRIKYAEFREKESENQRTN